MASIDPVVKRLHGLVFGVLAVGLARPAAAADPIEEPPALRPCPSGDSARTAIEDALAELQKIHRVRVPGPSGQVVLDRKLDELLSRFVRFEHFADLALGDAWDAAVPEQRTGWSETLRYALERRYLRRLGSPLDAVVQVAQSEIRCDEGELARARIRIELASRRSKSRQEVLLQLAQSRRPEEPAVWQAFDVAVDGVSLLENWRGQFRRIYAEGGLAAVDHHIKVMRDRTQRGDGD